MADNPQKGNGNNQSLSINECFVIMPISDPEGYDKGHFKKVYDDIFTPAIENAGFKPIRADDNKGTNFIQLEILKKIIECPLALCDLSTKNPNVMFELGIRQAFDLPVVLVKEVGTSQIFDIASIRYHEYKPKFQYREVLEDQRKIEEMIRQTMEESKSGATVNSIIKLLSITQSASLVDVKASDESNLSMKVLMNEFRELKNEIRNIHQLSTANLVESDIVQGDRRFKNTPKISSIEMAHISDLTERFNLYNNYLERTDIEKNDLERIIAEMDFYIARTKNILAGFSSGDIHYILKKLTKLQAEYRKRLKNFDDILELTIKS